MHARRLYSPVKPASRQAGKLAGKLDKWFVFPCGKVTELIEIQVWLRLKNSKKNDRRLLHHAIKKLPKKYPRNRLIRGMLADAEEIFVEVRE